MSIYIKAENTEFYRMGLLKGKVRNLIFSPVVAKIIPIKM